MELAEVGRECRESSHALIIRIILGRLQQLVGGSHARKPADRDANAQRSFGFFRHSSAICGTFNIRVLIFLLSDMATWLGSVL